MKDSEFTLFITDLDTLAICLIFPPELLIYIDFIMVTEKELFKDVRVLSPEEVSETMDQVKRFYEETYSMLENEELQKGHITSRTVKSAMLRVGNQERYGLFHHIVSCYSITPAAFKTALRMAWIYGKMYEEEALLDFYWIGLGRMLNAKERKLYNSLPKTITIYRGCHKDEATLVRKYRGKPYPDFHSFWTLDRGVAEFYAFKGKHFRKEDGRVYSISIKKSQMLALFLDRYEDEVIYPYSYDGYYKPYTLVTDKPTAFFESFTNKHHIKIN